MLALISLCDRGSRGFMKIFTAAKRVLEDIAESGKYTGEDGFYGVF